MYIYIYNYIYIYHTEVLLAIRHSVGFDAARAAFTFAMVRLGHLGKIMDQRSLINGPFPGDTI